MQGHERQRLAGIFACGQGDFFAVGVIKRDIEIVVADRSFMLIAHIGIKLIGHPENIDRHIHEVRTQVVHQSHARLAGFLPAFFVQSSGITFETEFRIHNFAQKVV